MFEVLKELWAVWLTLALIFGGALACVAGFLLVPVAQAEIEREKRREEMQWD
jgi:uncharacterized protein involved in exopolysaccharide biosynthesis